MVGANQSRRHLIVKCISWCICINTICEDNTPHFLIEFPIICRMLKTFSTNILPLSILKSHRLRSSGQFRKINFIMTESTILGSDQEKSPVYFWREHEEPHGVLSQWYECAFEHQGTIYRSTEMWMMVQKAVLFGDEVGCVNL